MSRTLDRASRVDRIADNLVRKFQAPGSRDFFCKCAWNMSEDEIWTTFEKAHKKGIQSPLKYFVAVCSIMLQKK